MYQYYKNILKNEPLPLMFVDTDLLDQNIDAVLQRAKGKTIRIASKSIRSVFIIEYILNHPSRQFKGIMTYNALETAFLCQKGFDNLLLGYPCYQSHDIQALVPYLKAGKDITLMTDCIDHIIQINKIAIENQIVIPICLDIDMSTAFPALHFGVYRSPLNSLKKVKKLVQQLPNYPNVKLTGIMGYEAQISGVSDNEPNQNTKNKIVKKLKHYSIKQLSKRRTEVIEYLQSKGYKLTIINGGGTGSLESTIQEPLLNEITAGSAFYAPAIFDHYAEFKHLPAAAFALEITRQPAPNIYTCNGGGYIASGSTSPNKQPKPYLPTNATLIANEGAGEVQTPIRTNYPLAIGDPILLRHSKAGELCERFEQIILISKGIITHKTPTYRGENKCFM